MMMKYCPYCGNHAMPMYHDGTYMCKSCIDYWEKLKREKELEIEEDSKYMVGCSI